MRETTKPENCCSAWPAIHTIVVIEHDMTFVRQIARKVTVLHQGALLCEGTVDKVQSDARSHRGLPGPAEKKHESN